MITTLPWIGTSGPLAKAGAATSATVAPTVNATTANLFTSDLRFGVPLPVRLRLAIGSALDPFP